MRKYGCLPPILLTSSVIAMDETVRLKDPQSRIFHTLESLEKWLEITPTSQFVLCDGSGFDFSSLIEGRFRGAQIECLSFNNNPELISIYGKGFGEGEIIRYALEHSVFLREAQWFVKCTAKLWVDNYFDCLEEWNGRFLCKAYFSNVFSLKRMNLEYIDTRFYLADKSYYQNHFSGVYQALSKNPGISIEEQFLEVVQSAVLQGILFSSPPMVSGVGGGSGKYYKDSFWRRLKERVRTKIVSLSPRYKLLFSNIYH